MSAFLDYRTNVEQKPYILLQYNLQMKRMQIIKHDLHLQHGLRKLNRCALNISNMNEYYHYF
jgi:hypothetical protein